MGPTAPKAMAAWEIVSPSSRNRMAAVKVEISRSRRRDTLNKRNSSSRRGSGMRIAASSSPGLQIELFVALVEVVDVHFAAAAGAGQFELGFRDEQERQRVGDRRGVDDVAADRADVADLRRAEDGDDVGELRDFLFAQMPAISVQVARAPATSARPLFGVLDFAAFSSATRLRSRNAVGSITRLFSCTPTSVAPATILRLRMSRDGIRGPRRASWGSRPGVRRGRRRRHCSIRRVVGQSAQIVQHRGRRIEFVQLGNFLRGDLLRPACIIGV